MKKHLLLLLFIFGLPNQAQAQVKTFQKIISNSPHRSEARQLIALPDTTYMIINHYLTKPDYTNAIAFMKIDKQGNLLFKKDYTIYSHGPIWESSLGHVVYSSKNNTFSLGSSFFNGTDLDFHIAQFNSQADTLWTKVYDTGERDGNVSLCATLDGGFIISGESSLYDSRDMYVIKMDALGNKEWTKNYETDEYLNTTHQVSLDTVNGGGYIIGGKCFHKEQEDEAYDGYGMITKIDEQGNLLWRKVYENDYLDNCFSYILPYPEGGYISWGCGITDQFGSEQWPYMERLDEQGNPIWRTEIRHPWALARFFLNNVKILPDGQIVAVGRLEYLGPVGWIAKYDVASGEQIWLRIYDHITPLPHEHVSTREGFYDVVPTPDDGLLVSGHMVIRVVEPGATSGFSVEEPWILQLDSAGCLYPNNCPDNDSIPWFYHIIEINEPEIVPSTGGLPTNEVGGFKVYPNPAQNTLYLQIANDVVADAPFQLAIYDLMGRLMLQQDIQQSHQQIDTKQLPDGMYLYHIQQNNTTIYKDKLLIVR